jgi:hypothetical protein
LLKLARNIQVKPFGRLPRQRCHYDGAFFKRPSELIGGDILIHQTDVQIPAKKSEKPHRWPLIVM